MSVIAQPQKQQGQRSIIEIYTDWANHYLEKLPKKAKITNLQTEVCDGVVLADVVEAVMSQKVGDINRKPKTQQQTLSNVQNCLKFLSTKGVAVSEISAKEIRDGNLKAILGLFFQLSRYKQQQKMQQRGQGSVLATPGAPGMRSNTPRIPSVPNSPAKTAIPLPDSPKKSQIPSGGTSGRVASLGGRQMSASALKPPSSLSSVKSQSSGKSTIPSKSSSMLERFKLKRTGSSSGPTLTSTPTSPSTRTQAAPSIPTYQQPQSSAIRYQYSPRDKGLGKRTSSSSGFSSARSMASESSGVSASSDTNFPSPSALRRISENSTFSSPQKLNPNVQSSPNNQRKLPGNKKVSNSRNNSPNSRGSPKRSPKLSKSNKLEKNVTKLKDYGLIDNPPSHKDAYPPHVTSSASRIPSTGISGPNMSANSQRVMTPPKPGQGTNGNSGIPCPLRSDHSSKNSIPTPPLVQGCPIKPLQKNAETEHVQEQEQDEENVMAASFQSRSCSLPRPKRREEMSPGPANVAVVSPMPSLKKGMSLDHANEVMAAAAAKIPENDLKCDEDAKDEDIGDGKAPLPMQPLFGKENNFKSPQQEYSGSHNCQEEVSSAVSKKGLQPSVETGYLSDGDVAFFTPKHHSTFTAAPGILSSNHPFNLEDGYLSEGGASFYSKKIQSRLAFEKQKAVKEQRQLLEQKRTNLPGLPEVLGSSNDRMNSNPGSPTPIYRVVSGRKHVPRSEAGMQTEASSALSAANKQHVDWKQAMAHNARILSSQEKAMDEYLKRQRSAAEQHILHANQQMDHQKIMVPMVGGTSGFQSVPATPTEIRRNNQNINKQYIVSQGNKNEGTTFGNGGSLERQKQRMRYDNTAAAYSDSEYGRILGSPMANRKSYLSMPHPNNQSQFGKRDAVFGSRSLPKGTSSLNYGLMLDRIQQKRQYKPLKINDGSLSDSNYATYTDFRANSQSPYAWLGPASTYAQDPTAPWSNRVDSMSGMSSNNDIMGSNESLNSVSSSIQQARANSLTKARLMMHQRNSPPKTNFKKTPSEVSYASNTSASTNRNDSSEFYGVPSFRLGPQPPEPIHLSRFKCHPGSPTKPNDGGKFIGTTSNACSSLPIYPDRPQDTMSHANSQLSLVSTNTTYNQGQDATTDMEIRKLRKELLEEHEKVQHLTSQLATNAHVVSAFEQSLANMTSRLQHLTETSEKKESEVNELKRIIEMLRKSGAEAGLIKHPSSGDPNALMRQKSNDSMISNSSTDEFSGKKSKSGPKRSGWLRSSFSKAFIKGQNQSDGKQRKASKVGSISDVEDNSLTSQFYYETNDRKDPQPPPRCQSAASGSVYPSDNAEKDLAPEVITTLRKQLLEKDTMLTETRLEALSSAHQLESLRETVARMKNEMMSLKSDNERLQSIMHKNNKSLHSSQSSLNGSTSNSNTGSGDKEDDFNPKARIGDPDEDDDEENNVERRLSVTMSEVSVLSGPSSLDLSASTDPTNKEGGKLVTVSVLKGSSGEEIRLGVISVSGKSTWDLLDSLIHRLFKEYVMRVDPTSNLGLNADSIASYDVGEVNRTKNSPNPEYLPYGYLVGNVTTIQVNLHQSCHDGQVDALALDTLTPKSILQRFVSLLTEHKRVILSGQSGTGKSFMAQKLAQFLVDRRNSSNSPSTPTNNNGNHMGSRAVVTFTVDMNNANEFHTFLEQISEQSKSSDNMNPFVLIMENLHHAGNLDEVFGKFLTADITNCPYIIGTLNRNSGLSSTTTNLQLKHNFRWVLYVSHIEPVQGFLGRYLRQKLLAVETKTRQQDGEMANAVEWIARLFVRLNRLIESQTSSEYCLSPKMFLSCPVHAKASRIWFINLWNSTLVPYLTNCFKDGIQMYGKRVSWEDPVKYLYESWPWSDMPRDELGSDMLQNISLQDFDPENGIVMSPDSQTRPESCSRSSSELTDPGKFSPGEGVKTDEDSGNADPLFNMLMHLQEAAAGNNFK